MQSNTSETSQSGMTLFETVISLALLVVAFGIVVETTTQTGQYTGTVVAVSWANQNVHRTVARIAHELIQSSSSTFAAIPTPPVGATELTYQRVESFAAGAPVWGPQRTLLYRMDPSETDDGLDDDGDGLIDEGQVIQRTDPGGPDQHDEILCDRVAELFRGEIANGLDDNNNGLIDEAGLSFEVDGDSVIIRLSVQTVVSGGRVVTRSAETTVALRN